MSRLTISALALALPTAALAADPTPCAHVGGQQIMNACIADKVREADQALSRIYGEVAAMLDPLGKHNIVAAERAWMAFRDKECSFRAGYDDEHLEINGTLAPYLVGVCMLDLTNKRIGDLRQQLKCPGGDMSCEN